MLGGKNGQAALPKKGADENQRHVGLGPTPETAMKCAPANHAHGFFDADL